MLCQFNFKNYKSFRHEATLDLQAAAISEHLDTLLVDSDEERFLPLAVIYGPNGGGKSTILDAFAFLVQFILRPIYLLKNSQEVALKGGRRSVPFKFDEESRTAPTEFELFFRTKNAEYRYDLHLIKDVVCYESLSRLNKNGKKAMKIFVREKDKTNVQVAALLKKLNVTDVAETMPFLAYVKILSEIPVIDEVIEWFQKCQFIDYGDPLADLRITLLDNEKSKEMLLQMMQEMDIDICSLRYEKKSDKIDVFTKHQIGEFEYELDLDEESSGTFKLVGLLPLVIRALKTGGVMVADEMDAKLHPKLIKYIVELFCDVKSNPHHAQLIFTSHDLSTMKKEVFRRDEIWFVAKDNNQSSKLYSLVDFKDEAGNSVRKDATFDKQYLEGKYGADPYLQRCLDWEKIL